MRRHECAQRTDDVDAAVDAVAPAGLHVLARRGTRRVQLRIAAQSDEVERVEKHRVDELLRQPGRPRVRRCVVADRAIEAGSNSGDQVEPRIRQRICGGDRGQFVAQQQRIDAVRLHACERLAQRRAIAGEPGVRIVRHDRRPLIGVGARQIRPAGEQHRLDPDREAHVAHDPHELLEDAQRTELAVLDLDLRGGDRVLPKADVDDQRVGSAGKQRRHRGPQVRLAAPMEDRRVVAANGKYGIRHGDREGGAPLGPDRRSMQATGRRRRPRRISTCRSGARRRGPAIGQLSPSSRCRSWILRVMVLRPMPRRSAASMRRPRVCRSAVRITALSNARVS